MAQIDAGPGAITNDSQITFQFTSNTTNVDFSCMLEKQGQDPLLFSLNQLLTKPPNHIDRYNDIILILLMWEPFRLCKEYMRRCQCLAEGKINTRTPIRELLCKCLAETL